MSEVRPDRLKIFIELFEDSLEPLGGLDGTNIEGVAIWDLRRRLNVPNLDEWPVCFKLAGYAATYKYVHEAQYFWVDVKRVPNEPLTRFSCPETLAIREVALDELAVYQINEQKFIAGVLEILRPRLLSFQPSIIPMSKYCWYLGMATIERGVNVPLYLARGIERGYQPIYDVLSENCAYGLVLHSGRADPDLFKWPTGVQVQQLWDVLIGESLDFKWRPPLQQDVNAEPVPEGTSVIVLERQNQKCTYDIENQILTIVGKPDWHINGKRAGAVVHYLVEQAYRGRWEIPAKELLDKTKTDFGGAGRVPSIFRGNDQWETYISRPKHGYYGLNLELISAGASA